MSLRTLPILFLNLGGEMLYILDQRLRAQSIPDEKARKGKVSISRADVFAFDKLWRPLEKALLTNLTNEHAKYFVPKT